MNRVHVAKLFDNLNKRRKKQKLLKKENNVSKNELQLVGLTALLVAAKFEEGRFQQMISEFIYLTDNSYTNSDVKQMEIRLLRSIKFLIAKPLPLHFLRRFSRIAKVIY